MDGIDDIAKRIESLRVELLFDESEDHFYSPIAEQHFLAALAALEQAHRQMAIAGLHETREIAAVQKQRGEW